MITYSEMSFEDLLAERARLEKAFEANRKQREDLFEASELFRDRFTLIRALIVERCPHTKRLQAGGGSKCMTCGHVEGTLDAR